ncbi:MAG: hypothetical protein CML12_04790 [Puniceicoccaceae bacterium]|nr:hypothetical protein [Puniceicoccaceae bacterium]RCL30468.1 MAG: DUF1573 domain-containing protein [Puniceicoccaceae bacterium]
MPLIYSMFSFIRYAMAVIASLVIIDLGLVAETRQVLAWNATEISQLLPPDKDFAKAIFTVQNKGAHPARILRVESESNAIKVILKSKILEPGASATIEILFLAEGKNAGLYHNKAQVFFEGHEVPIATLHFIVTIPKLIELSPNTLIWNKTNRDQAFTVELTLDDRYIKTLVGVEYDEALYQVLLIPDETKSNLYQLEIRPLVSERPFNSLIKIHASGPTVSEATEPLFLFNSFTLSQ